MRSIKQYYTRTHPHWPNNDSEALDEISEINDILDKGGLNKQQRNWAYERRRKLVRFVNDPEYKAFTTGVNNGMKVVDNKDNTESTNNG